MVISHGFVADQAGRTPLMLAVLEGWNKSVGVVVRLVTTLLDGGADASVKNTVHVRCYPHSAMS